MSATYPTGIYVPVTKDNKSGVVYDSNKRTIVFAEDFNRRSEEIVAIENELGTIPAGDFTNVKTRIEAGEIRNITFITDGGGVAITTGEKGHLEIPFNCEIQRVTLLADQTGSIKIDIWKDTYANFPPTDADTICGANEPEIASGVKDQDATLTDWTKTIAAGSILAFNVDSAATITRLTISLKVKIIS